MAESPIYVLKFGSSVLRDAAALPEAVHEIYRRVREGARVVAVVSALGPTTDELLDEAAAYGCGPGLEPDANAVAALVATGESRAVALLALALGRAGVIARALDSAAIGLRTTGPLLDGQTNSLDTEAIRASLRLAPVLVIPGFLGRAPGGEISLLGRGGSDLTALFVAAELEARCTLLKDVDGLYDRDPAGCDGGEARRYETVSYEDVLALSEGIVQHKAVRFARDRGLEFEVSCCAGTRGTTVGRRPSRKAAPAPAPRILRVGLLGLGTVGRGVYDELCRQNSRFRISGVLVRDVEKHILAGIPERILTQEGETVVAPGAGETPDIVIEALGGTQLAAHLVRLALGRGVHVVTANKQLIAEHGDELQALAERNGARLLYSAAVGGAVPMLEAARRLRGHGIQCIEGVVNGTTNYVLNRVSKGLAFGDALAEAQRLGLAESDPTDDIEGIDAARKLVLLCREAFGITYQLSDISVRGIRGTGRERGREVHWRLVARAERTRDGVKASVGPEEVGVDHPLADLPGVRNSLVLTTTDGQREVVSGLAAGRLPTSESVLADVLQLRRECDFRQDATAAVSTRSQEVLA